MSAIPRNLPITKESPDIGEHRHYYFCTRLCGNCLTRNSIYILKGIPMSDAYKDCEKCGCTITFQGGRV